MRFKFEFKIQIIWTILTFLSPARDDLSSYVPELTYQLPNYFKLGLLSRALLYTARFRSNRLNGSPDHAHASKHVLYGLLHSRNDSFFCHSWPKIIFLYIFSFIFLLNKVFFLRKFKFYLAHSRNDSFFCHSWPKITFLHIFSFIFLLNKVVFH